MVPLYVFTFELFLRLRSKGYYVPLIHMRWVSRGLLMLNNEKGSQHLPDPHQVPEGPMYTICPNSVPAQVVGISCYYPQTYSKVANVAKIC